MELDSKNLKNGTLGTNLKLLLIISYILQVKALQCNVKLFLVLEQIVERLTGELSELTEKYGPACGPAWADLWAGPYSKNRKNKIN